MPETTTTKTTFEFVFQKSGNKSEVDSILIKKKYFPSSATQQQQIGKSSKKLT